MKLAQLLNLHKLAARKTSRTKRVTSQSPRPPADTFVLESLEQRLLLSAAPVPTTEMPASAPAAVAAVVTTDKADYSPGETAVITTSNTNEEGVKFAEGETVEFQVTRTDGIQDYPNGNLPWYVTDGVGGFDPHQEYDASGQAVDRNGDGMADWIRPDNDGTVNGSISTNWFVEDQYLGASLQLTATGQANGAVATTAFTDSGAFSYTTTSGFATTVSLPAGSTNSTALSVDVNAPKNNGDFNVSLSFATTGSTSIGIGTGADQINLTSVTRSFTTTKDLDDTDTFGITVSVGTGVAAGTYHFKATGIESPSGIADGSGWAFDVIVSASTTATTTSVSSSSSTSTYGNSVTFTAIVNAASGSAAPTGSVEFFDGATSLGTDSVANSTGTGTSTWSITTSGLNAGTHSSIRAVYTATGSFTGSTSANFTQTVNKANATINVTPYTATYNANSHTATGSATGVNGESLNGLLNLSGTMHTNAGTYNDSWSFAGNTNYNIASGTVTDVINKANAVVSVSGYTGTYDAGAHGATGTATGVDTGGAALGGTLNLGASFTNYPGGTANWTFTGGTNYNDQSGSVAIVINKANAVVSVSGYTGTYDAGAHGATGTATGVDTGGAALGGTLNLGASFTNYPGGTANWTFTGGTNYNDQSGSVAIVINKANAVVSVSGYTGTYDAGAHGATGTATGVDTGGAALGGTLNLGASFTNYPGGTANWTFTGGTNYNDQSGSVAIVINKANAVVSVSGYTGTYDAGAHGATGTATGVDTGGAALGGTLNLGASFTNYPGGTANWTFTGGTNYNDQSGSVAIVINKANAVVSVSGYTGTYDAGAHGATGTATGVDTGGAALGGTLNLGASFTNYPGGTANWTFTGGTNYNDQSGSVAIVINKANAVVSVSGYTGTYDAGAHGATGTATGVDTGGAALGGTLNLGASFTNYPGGTANWTFTGGTNYNDQSGSVAIVINKANAVVSVSGYTGTYDAGAHGATGTATGVDTGGAALGGTLNLGASFTNYPGGTANWTFTGGTNYNDQSGSVAIVINKANAVVSVSGYTGTYDAGAHGATGTATGVDTGGAALGGTLNLGASFTNYPGGTANWTFTGGTNYNDQSGSVAIVINKANAVVSVSGYTGTYDAGAHGATGTATGVDTGGAALGGTLNLGASFTNYPGGTANWTFTGGTNYNDQSGSVAIVINKADLTINVSNLTKTFGQTINLANVLGTTLNTGINGETLCVSHSCAGTSAAALVGNYPITCEVSDGAGMVSNYNVTVNPGTLTVMTPSVITAVQDGGNLIIVGTEGMDTIDVNASNPGAIKINGNGSYSVSPTGHVIVYGMGSADNLNLTGNVNLEAHGGYGNDTITGGAGNDVLFGDAGDDTLTGSAGNDVLVGGSGSDRLVGSAGHDILIAGELTGSRDYAAMRTLSDNWAAQWGIDPDLVDTNADGDVVDEAGDQLTGSAGHDWFIISSNDKITDINSMTKDQDKITSV